MSKHPTGTSADGLSVAVWGHGDPADPTVVLIPGYPDTHRVWDGVGAALAGSHHVVAYDVRGAGSSDVPPSRAGYDLARLSEDLVAVVDATSPHGPAPVVGHDWGSVQAREPACPGAPGDRLDTFTAQSGPDRKSRGAGKELGVL